MNTKTLKYSILLALVLVIGVFGTVYAAGPNQPETVPAYGQQAAAANEDGTGLIHDDLMQAFAEAVGADVETIEARLDAGETLFEIAESYDYSVESLNELMASIHTAAREEMIAEGLMMGRGGRWASDNTFAGGPGMGMGTGTCISEDGEPLYDGQQFGGQNTGRGRRGN